MNASWGGGSREPSSPLQIKLCAFHKVSHIQQSGECVRNRDRARQRTVAQQRKPARVYEKADSGDDDRVGKKTRAHLCNLHAPERPPPPCLWLLLLLREPPDTLHLHIYDKRWLKRKTTRWINSACYAMRTRRRARSKGRETHKRIGGGGHTKERSRFFFFGPIGDRFEGCDVISSSLGPCWLVPLLRMAPCLRWKDG